MKPYKNVDATRAAYHEDPARNSVHRSSLTVPTMPGTSVEISFLNHFLIKRNYDNVACRVTAIDADGNRIEARLFPVTEPRVYTLPLSQIFGAEACSFLVDFFAADNLFIPFPAVMINHRGHGFANVVHSFNRILNDVFEDDDINNTVPPPEASIDPDGNDAIEGFFVFSSGMQPVADALNVEFSHNETTHVAKIPASLPRFTSLAIKFRDAITALENGADTGVLKIQQPAQPMYFGRLFTGRQNAQGAFSANHSYYDSSATAEYWDNDAAGYRSYPYFPGVGTRIRFHPIMSPGTLEISVGLHNQTGRERARIDAGTLTSPGTTCVDADIDRCIEDAGLRAKDISCFAVHARPASGNTPTRINHQLIYGRVLFSSINVSLKNPNVYAPDGKTGLTWGQVLAGGGSEGFLGIVGDDPAGAPSEIEITVYDATGELGRSAKELPAGGAVIVDIEQVTGQAPVASDAVDSGTCYWYVARSERRDLTAIGLSRHAACEQVTGEHGF